MSTNFSYAWLNDLADETGVETVYLEKDLVLTTIIRTLASGPLADNLVLKIRAMYQRGNRRDLFDLWFIFFRANVMIDFGKVNDLIPHKFDPDIVAGGWNRGRLYARIREQENEWAGALKALVPAADRVSFDEALSVVETALRPLRK